MTEIINLSIAAFFTVIAIWSRWPIVFLLAGFAWMIVGFPYWSTNHYMSILLVLVGFGCFGGAKWAKK